MRNNEMFYCANDTVPGTDLYVHRLIGHTLPEAGFRNHIGRDNEKTSLISDEIIGITSDFISKDTVITACDGLIRRMSGHPSNPGLVGRVVGIVYHYPECLPDGQRFHFIDYVIHDDEQKDIDP